MRSVSRAAAALVAIAGAVAGALGGFLAGGSFLADAPDAVGVSWAPGAAHDAWPECCTGPSDPIRLLVWGSASPEELLSRARQELETGTPEGRAAARDLFLEAIHRAPDDPRGYLGLVDAWVRGVRSADLSPDRTGAAIAFALQAVARQPDDAEAHFVLATAYLRQFWFRRSIEHLLRSWELDPQARTAYWLGWMYSEIGELHQILPWLDRALVLDSGLPGLAAELGYAHRVLRNFDEAEVWLRRAIAEDDEDAYAHGNLLLLLLMQRRDREAVRHADGLTNRHPDDPAMLGRAGLTYWYTGDDPRAQSLLEAAAALDPQLWIGTWGTIVTQPLGEIYWRAGRQAEARAAFANAVAGYRQRFERASEGWGYRYDLAAMAAVQGEHEEAFAWLRDAIAFGWTDTPLARRDPSLASLRANQAFQELMDDVDRRVAVMRAAAPAP
jgi:tetratricopeptide (TPR) repeat protein